MRDLLPAAETLAKGVKHIACYVADAISERCNGFSDDEAGDYLACAGADALAESLGRMESDGSDAADAWLPLRSEKVGSFGYREFFPTPAAHGAAADGPSAACDIPPSPAEGHPTRKSDVCKHCGNPIDLVIGKHSRYGRAGVWLHVGGDGRCRSTYATPE